MKIAVLSDTRRPTLPDCPHGLGKSTFDIAAGLALRGHDVTLFAGLGSQFPYGELVVNVQEADRIRHDTFDVYLDSSHHHDLSREHPGWPVLNRIADLEYPYDPPNAIVESRYVGERLPRARFVAKGVDVDAISFSADHDGYLAFLGRINAAKGYRRALHLGERVHFAGPNEAGAHLPRYAGVLAGADKWRFLGCALGLVLPSINDVAPRTPLEAAACGTPTLCLDGDGTQEHVEDCVSGFICADMTDMAEAVDYLPHLDRRAVRDWVAAHHPLARMIDGYEAALVALADGERW